MNLQAEKLELVKAILDIDDISLVKEVKALLKKQDHDWFDDLSEEQQESVMRGIAQADRGEVVPHEEAVKRLGL